MKKIIICCLILCSFSVHSKTIRMDEKKPNDNELFIDEQGLYRYKRAEDVYKHNCQDSPTEEIRKKCMDAEKAAWAKGKTEDEINNEGALFNGKIKVHHSNGKEDYFYVKEGQKGEKIHLLRTYYYFEGNVLYDIRTEQPASADIVIGGVEGLTSTGKAPRFIAQQKYKNGLPEGNPVLIPVKK